MKSSLFRWMCCEWLKYVELNGENILEMLFSINIFSRSFPAINLKFQHSSIEMKSQVSHIRKNIFIIHSAQRNCTEHHQNDELSNNLQSWEKYHCLNLCNNGRRKSLNYFTKIGFSMVVG